MFLDDSATAELPAARDLVAEANHRIANSLSSIGALVRRAALDIDPQAHMTGTAARQLLDETTARIDAVARLHRVLSDTDGGGTVDATTYLQRIASETVSTLAAPGAVRLHVVGELGGRIAAERALCLGLIVVELVTNAIKYAHPSGVSGSIAIRCRRDPGSLVVEVSDDGVGLPEHFDSDGGGSGLQLVRSLARQLGGSARFSSDGLGLMCRVEVPTLVSA